MLGYYPVWCFTTDGKIYFNDISDDEIDEILDGINGFQERIQKVSGKAID